MRTRAPPDIEVHAEVQFSTQPNQPDLLLLRRSADHRHDHEAQVLRGLWQHIDRAALVEFKSPVGRFRRNGLLRLCVYGTLFHMEERDRHATGKVHSLERPEQLTLVLVVPSINKPLREELDEMGWRCEPLGSGYARIVGPVYNTILVVTDEVSIAERDEYLQIFSNHSITERGAVFWWRQWQRETIMEDIENVEGSDEIFAKMLEALPPRLRLASLTPEQRLADLSLEQRLADFSPKQLADALRALPEDVRALIRRKLDDSDAE